MNLAKLKIGTRLRLGFALVLTLLVIVTALGIAHMTQMQARVNEITKVNNVKTRLATAMRDTVFERMIALRNMALIVSMSYMVPEADRIKEQTKKYGDAVQELNKMFDDSAISSQQEKALLIKIREQETAALPLIAKATELAMLNQVDQVYDTLVTKLLPRQTAWMAALAELVALEEKQNQLAALKTQAAYDKARVLMLSIGTVAMSMGLAIALLLPRSLIRQLGGEPAYAVEVAGRIAEGDLASVIDTENRDQTSLLFAMKTMRDNLAAIVGKVRANTDTIASTSNEIASGNLDLSHRTEEQAASLEKTAASMEQLAATVKHNAENARQANALAVSASEVAIKGGTLVSEVIETMGSINASAKRIVDIISVIDSIAFQTNILALNAAVEAARAGAQGLGFAVVATEVRNLAQRSASAAREIKILIGDSVHKIDRGTRLVNQAGATMDDIVASVKHVTSIMAEISTATREQNAGIEQVSSAIVKIDEVTQHNAALVEQAAAAAASLQRQAAELGQAVSAFRLESWQPAAANTRQEKPPLDQQKHAGGIPRLSAEPHARKSVSAGMNVSTAARASISDKRVLEVVSNS